VQDRYVRVVVTPTFYKTFPAASPNAMYGTEIPFDRQQYPETGQPRYNNMYMFQQKVRIYSPTSFRLTFDAKWSPKIEIYRDIRKRFPSLSVTLAHSECGNGFAGVYLPDGTEKNVEIEIELGK
jgi:hypothetical protein